VGALPRPSKMRLALSRLNAAKQPAGAKRKAATMRRSKEKARGGNGACGSCFVFSLGVRRRARVRAGLAGSASEAPHQSTAVVGADGLTRVTPRRSEVTAGIVRDDKWWAFGGYVVVLAGLNIFERALRA
jgi:hypothetical protein